MGTRLQRQIAAATVTRPMTLMELVKMAEERLWESKKHRDQCYLAVRDAATILGNPLVSEITTQMIDKVIEALKPNYRPATVNRKMMALHTLLNFAFDREMIQKMPKFQWFDEDNERIRWLSAEEEEQLLKLLPPDLAAFCEILIHTGMRRGELLSLKPEQIDGDYARLWRTKNGKARSVPLSPRAKELLEQWVPFDMNLTYMNTEWNKVRKAMGMKNDRNFVLHMLRHTTATRWLDATSNIVLVQKVLGHARLETTMRYAHTSDDQLLQGVGLVMQKYDKNGVTA
jgi:integrase